MPGPWKPLKTLAWSRWARWTGDFGKFFWITDSVQRPFPDGRGEKISLPFSFFTWTTWTTWTKP